MDFKNDPIGQAIYDYKNGKHDTNIIVHSDLCDDDNLPVEYLFREFKDMPPLEKKALEFCKGKILDVGAAAGCHSKYLLEKNFDTHAIDTSKGSFEHLQDLNISVKNTAFLNLKSITFDTILLLMNGIGIAGRLDKLDVFLNHCNLLLNKEGIVICDSTDINYLYEDNEGGRWTDLNSSYYGEMEFQMEYKSNKGEWFDWLYIDFETLKKHAEKAGFKIEKVFESENNEFLATLTKI